MTSLDGITVIDASRVLAGPYATMLLADLGADVIKIERPGGDDTRAWGPPYLGDAADGLSAYYLSVNRNKRSVCVDFKTGAGRDVLRKLLAKADVFVENFAPGAAERLGVGPDVIRAANESIVHCSITAFGDKPGPGYDLAIQGMSGLMSITGEPDGEPMKVGVAITDVVAGLQASSAILAALVARQRTSRGDRIVVSLLGSAVAALVNVAQAHLVSVSGAPPGRFGNAHPQIVPYQAFASADGHFTAGAGNDKLFGLLCALIGRPELAGDNRFATNPSRVRNRDALIGILAPIFRQKTTAHWLGALGSAGVPCGPVNTLPMLFGDDEDPPGVEMLQLETSSGMSYRSVGSPAQMAGARERHTSAPTVGQHTDEVLRELLGLDEEAIQDLRSEGAVR